MQKLRFQIASTGDFYPRPDHTKYQDIFGIFKVSRKIGKCGDNFKFWGVFIKLGKLYAIFKNNILRISRKKFGPF